MGFDPSGGGSLYLVPKNGPYAPSSKPFMNIYYQYAHQIGAGSISIGAGAGGFSGGVGITGGNYEYRATQTTY